MKLNQLYEIHKFTVLIRKRFNIWHGVSDSPFSLCAKTHNSDINIEIFTSKFQLKLNQKITAFEVVMHSNLQMLIKKYFACQQSIIMVENVRTHKGIAEMLLQMQLPSIYGN